MEHTITLSAGVLGGVQLNAADYADWELGQERLVTAKELTEDPDEDAPVHTLAYRRDTEGMAVYTGTQGTQQEYEARIAAAQ